MPDLASQGALMLYPRGFLGARLGPQIKKYPRPTDAQVRSLQNNVQLFQPGVASLPSNENVENLFRQYINGSASMGDARFRKKVLITALTAFGTPFFDYWFVQQLHSPSSGDLHRAFLDDTIKFIREGRRDQALETWASLLDFTDSGEVNTQVSEYAAEFFGISTNGQQRIRRMSSLNEIIQDWTSKPNGFGDLLHTLHVLFGSI